MEIKPLIKKLCIDFTTFYLYKYNKWLVYLLKVHWKPDVRVEENDFTLLRPARLGVLGSYNKEYMHVQIIVEQRNIEYLIRWLRILLEKAEHIISYATEMFGERRLTKIGLDFESLEMLAGNRGNQCHPSSCEPLLLINHWLSLLLSNDKNIFFFSDPLAHKNICNMHLLYSPLFYLKQKDNFIYLNYMSYIPSLQPKLYFFDCSFLEWWTYPCSPNTVVYHPTVHILNKITECGLYYIVLELDDVPSFLEKLVRFGFENSSIKCSYTLQSPRLRIENKIYLIIGYPVEELEDIAQMQNYLLYYLHDLNPIIISDHILEHLDCLSYPNKISRSIWTGNFRTCRLLCSTYDCERDGFDLDTLLSNMGPKVEVVSPTTGEKEYSLLPEVQKDVTYMREHEMDFIYVYRHHDPFTKQIKNDEKI